VNIRFATQKDTTQMCALVQEAFGEEGDLISELVAEMVSAEDSLTWVEENSGIRGLVGASRARVGSGGEGFWVLAPLGVSSVSQGLGIGGALVRHCLQELSDAGAHGVFVYGDPGYYGRFGFSVGDANSVKAPFDLEFPEGWQALLWKPIESEGSTSLRVTGPLDKPDLW